MAETPVDKQAAGAVEPGDKAPVRTPDPVDAPAPVATPPIVTPPVATPPIVTQGKLITDAVTETKIVQHNQYAAGGWLKSPATFEPFVAGEEALAGTTSPDNLQNGRLMRIRVAGYERGTKIYMWGTDPNDSQGLEIKRSKNRTWVNMRKLLAKMKVHRKPGLAERFDLITADAESPIQPALMLNLLQPRDRAHFPTTKKKGEKKKSDKKKDDKKKIEDKQVNIDENQHENMEEKEKPSN